MSPFLPITRTAVATILSLWALPSSPALASTAPPPLVRSAGGANLFLTASSFIDGTHNAHQIPQGNWRGPDLSLTATAPVASFNGTSIANTLTAHSHYNSDASGNFDFSESRNIISSTGQFPTATSASYAFEWTYTFTLTNPATLNLTYIMGGSDLGNDTTTIALFGNNGLLYRIDDRNSSGGTQVNFGAGTYSLDFKVDGGSPDGPFLNFNGGLTGEFNWSFIPWQPWLPSGPIAMSHLAAAAAVPEPASWALMLGGFGLVGGTLRSSRRRAAALIG